MKMLHRQLIIASVINLFVLTATAQTGNTFWFVAPDITEGHGDEPVYLRLSTYGNNTTATVSMPANPAFIPIVVNIAANSTETIDLTNFKQIIENQPADTVLNKGIRIQSTSIITAYYEVQRPNNPDIFALKSNNALGKHFVVPAQTYWDNIQTYTPVPYSSFEIVATENNTSVTIIPKQPIAGHNANASFTITLNQGETYSARALGYLGSQHLGGSIITSDKDIAVTLNDDSGGNTQMGSCRDLMGDQLIPVRMLGSEYIVIRGFLGTDNDQPDRIYITAPYNNTAIYLNGNTNATATINEGEQHEIVLNNPSVYITTSKPVYVLHVTGFGCEVGQAVLPTIECTGSDSVSFTRSTNESFHILILCKNGSESQIRINGSADVAPPGQFNVVPGTNNEWVYARRQANTTQIPVEQASSIYSLNGDFFHVGIINGGATTGCRYGFFSDFNSIITPPIYRVN
jgi:hypothetical protein